MEIYLVQIRLKLLPFFLFQTPWVSGQEFSLLLFLLLSFLSSLLLLLFFFFRCYFFFFFFFPFFYLFYLLFRLPLLLLLRLLVSSALRRVTEIVGKLDTIEPILSEIPTRRLPRARTLMIAINGAAVRYTCNSRVARSVSKPRARTRSRKLERFNRGRLRITDTGDTT